MKTGFVLHAAAMAAAGLYLYIAPWIAWGATHDVRGLVPRDATEIKEDDFSTWKQFWFVVERSRESSLFSEELVLQWGKGWNYCSRPGNGWFTVQQRRSSGEIVKLEQRVLVLQRGARVVTLIARAESAPAPDQKSKKRSAQKYVGIVKEQYTVSSMEFDEIIKSLRLVCRQI